jgi:hypothetical protein
MPYKVVVLHGSLAMHSAFGVDVRQDVPAAKDVLAQQQSVIDAERVVSWFSNVDPLPAVHVGLAP